MTDKTLPERMREAADILLQVRERERGRDPHRLFAAYSADDLRGYADKWEQEDADTAAQQAEIHELAALIRDTRDDTYQTRAATIITAGWRKAQT